MPPGIQAEFSLEPPWSSGEAQARSNSARSVGGDCAARNERIGSTTSFGRGDGAERLPETPLNW